MVNAQANVVSYPAKVQIFQLITTLRDVIFNRIEVVSYPAKVQIFQLITTLLLLVLRLPRCFLPCKGTNFSANHNWLKTAVDGKNSCFLPCKGTNFSANHNSRSSSSFSFFVVSYPAKVQIFQLITTTR